MKRLIGFLIFFIGICLSGYSQDWEYLMGASWNDGQRSTGYRAKCKMKKVPNTNQILISYGGRLGLFEEGNVIWKRDYGSGVVNDPLPKFTGETHFVEVLSDGFLVVWDYYYPGYRGNDFPIDSAKLRKYFITKVDFDGNLIFQKNEIFNGYLGSFEGISISSFPVGKDKLVSVEHNGSQKIRCYDYEGNKLWEKNSPIDFGVSQPNVFQSANGNFWLVSNSGHIAEIDSESGDVLNLTLETRSISKSVLMDPEGEHFLFLYNDEIEQTDLLGTQTNSFQFSQLDLATAKPWVINRDAVFVFGHRDENFVVIKIDLNLGVLVWESLHQVPDDNWIWNPKYTSGIIELNENNDLFIFGHTVWENIEGESPFLHAVQINEFDGKVLQGLDRYIENNSFEFNYDFRLVNAVGLKNTAYLGYDNFTGSSGNGHPGNFIGNAYFIKGDSTIGNIQTEDVSGYVKIDTLKNCLFDVGEPTLANVNIKFSGSNGFEEDVFTGADGKFEIKIPTSVIDSNSLTYTVFYQNQKHEECLLNISNFTLPELKNLEIPIQVDYCSDLVIYPPADFELFNCSTSKIEIDYENLGNAPSNSILEIELDSTLVFMSSDFDHQIEQNKILFELEEVNPEEGRNIVSFIVGRKCDIPISALSCLKTTLNSGLECEDKLNNNYFEQCYAASEFSKDVFEIELLQYGQHQISFYRNTKGTIQFELRNDLLDTITNWKINVSGFYVPFDVFSIPTSSPPISLNATDTELELNYENISVAPGDSLSISLDMNFAKVYEDFDIDAFIFDYESILSGTNFKDLKSEKKRERIDLNEFDWNHQPEYTLYQNGQKIDDEINIFDTLTIEFRLGNERDFEFKDIQFELDLLRQVNPIQFLGSNILDPKITTGFSKLIIKYEDVNLPVGQIFIAEVYLNLMDCFLDFENNSSLNNSVIVSNECNYYESKVDFDPFEILRPSKVSDKKRPPLFQIFPNPSTNQINFNFQIPISNSLQFELFNIAGQKLLFQEVSGDFIIEKSEVGSGVFFFEMKESGVVVERGKLIFL